MDRLPHSRRVHRLRTFELWVFHGTLSRLPFLMISLCFTYTERLPFTILFTACITYFLTNCVPSFYSLPSYHSRISVGLLSYVTYIPWLLPSPRIIPAMFSVLTTIVSYPNTACYRRIVYLPHIPPPESFPKLQKPLLEPRTPLWP